MPSEVQRPPLPVLAPKGLSDRTAWGFVKALRFFADTFFAKRYGHRAVVLETVAAVPGMVGGLLQHLKALRHIRDDQGWIHLSDEPGLGITLNEDVLAKTMASQATFS